MKKVAIIVLMISVFSCKTVSSKDESIGLLNLSYQTGYIPEQKELNIIRYILSSIREKNIHKMRGEDNNIIMVNEDGREAVFDENEDIVTNYNKGSFNLHFADKEPEMKFLADSLPWFKWGSDISDPTTFEERLYYYTLDLDQAIQKYIFVGSKETLVKVDFKSLPDDQQEMYFMFIHLIFNDKYKIQLIEENNRKLIDDGAFYYEYFTQIQSLLGYTE